MQKNGLEMIEAVGLKEIVPLQESLGTVSELHTEVEGLKEKLASVESALATVSSNFLLTFLLGLNSPGHTPAPETAGVVLLR